jgi:alpha-galactosidase
VIAIDQDPLGRQGDRVETEGPLETWTKPLKGGAMAVAMFNRTSAPAEMRLRLAKVGWQGSAAARDLWSHKDLGPLSPESARIVPAHGVVLLRITKPASPSNPSPAP